MVATILITGAGTGFGHEVALRLAAKGFNVIVAVRNILIELAKSMVMSQNWPGTQIMDT